MLDQLSTKIRPNKKYKTDRAELDGSGLVDGLLLSGVFKSPWHVDFKKGIKLLTEKMPTKDAKALVKYYKDEYQKII